MRCDSCQQYMSKTDYIHNQLRKEVYASNRPDKDGASSQRTSNLGQIRISDTQSNVPIQLTREKQHLDEGDSNRGLIRDGLAFVGLLAVVTLFYIGFGG